MVFAGLFCSQRKKHDKNKYSVNASRFQSNVIYNLSLNETLMSSFDWSHIDVLIFNMQPKCSDSFTFLSIPHLFLGFSLPMMRNSCEPLISNGLVHRHWIKKRMLEKGGIYYVVKSPCSQRVFTDSPSLCLSCWLFVWVLLSWQHSHFCLLPWQIWLDSTSVPYSPCFSSLKSGNQLCAYPFSPWSGCMF